MKKIILFVFILLTYGCAISKNVSPVQPTVTIKKIYIENNEKVLMKELVNELVTQVKELGFESESYKDERPVDASHYLIYTGNWQWDMAMYLTYFKATLYEEGKVLGEMEYDAKSGGANMGKFGKTADKIRPLMTELLSKVKRPE